MNRYAQMISELKTPEVMKRLTYLYGQRGGMLVAQSARYSRLLKRHEELVGYEGPIAMVSAPGRTEIGGNHTDHNRGKVLAAAVNLDTLAAGATSLWSPLAPRCSMPSRITADSPWASARSRISSA